MSQIWTQSGFKSAAAKHMRGALGGLRGLASKRSTWPMLPLNRPSGDMTKPEGKAGGVNLEPATMLSMADSSATLQALFVAKCLHERMA